MEKRYEICVLADSDLTKQIEDFSTSSGLAVNLFINENYDEMVDCVKNHEISALIIDALEHDLLWSVEIVAKYKKDITEIKKVNIPVIIIIPEASKEDMKLAYDAGVTKIYTAPIDKSTLIKYLNDYFHNEFEEEENYKALIIEDDENQRNIVNKILTNMGLSVLEAEDGKDAEKYLYNADISIILSDIYMPYKDGFETCKMFKSRESFKHVPFIALTTRGNLENLKKILELGANDFINKPFSIDEFVSRIKVQLRLKKYYDEIQKHIAEEERLNMSLIDLNEKLNTMAITDYLTGVYNRRYIMEYLKTELEKCKRYEHDLSIMIIDIDYFKDINDTYGHNAGDEVLKNVCNLISDNIRQSDVFGRIGGEEFLVVYNDTDLKNAAAKSEKIRKLIEGKPIEYAKQKIFLTISIGVTEYSLDDNVDSIVNRADKGLYQAKETGRNKVVINS